MINELSNNQGFPDMKSDESNNWHGELYDWFSAKLGWPSYMDTQGAWELLILELRNSRGLISDGYRYRMLIERSVHSIGLIHGNPIQILSGQSVPIIHDTPNGFKLLRAVATEDYFIQIPYEFKRFIDPWFIMQVPSSKWQNSPKEGVNWEDMEFEMNRWTTYVQEIIFRSMCRSLQIAVYQEVWFECPWSRGICAISEAKCKKITALGTIL